MVNGNTANDLIVLPDEDEESEIKQNSTLQDTIKEMAQTAFSKYPQKTSLLTAENIDGMVKIDVLNDYSERNFGWRFKSLDELVTSKQNRIVSKDGFGLTMIIEFVKSIQATIEQNQMPEGMKSLLNRR